MDVQIALLEMLEAFDKAETMDNEEEYTHTMSEYSYIEGKEMSDRGEEDKRRILDG
jgi:hypothetical protein